MTLPPLPHPVVEAFGRPTWREWRRRSEAAALRSTSVPLDAASIRRVVVAPGFAGSAKSVAALVNWLADAGHTVQVADLEGNHRSSTWAVDRITEALAADDQPAVLIGHSRGGQQCRVATQRSPHLVDHLVTLGAPVRAHPPKHFVLRASVECLRLAAMLGALGGHDRQADRDYEATLFAPFAADVPWTAVHSRSDGFVAWQACIDRAAENVEVDCTHRGLIASVPAFEAIAAAVSSRPSVREHDTSR